MIRKFNTTLGHVRKSLLHYLTNYEISKFPWVKIITTNSPGKQKASLPVPKVLPNWHLSLDSFIQLYEEVRTQAKVKN